LCEAIYARAPDAKLATARSVARVELSIEDFRRIAAGLFEVSADL
jgi:hypothetical protein